MFTCICHAVTEREIIEVVDSGADTVDAVAYATGASTGCGTCHDRIEELIEERCGACPLVGLRVA
jgi:bacterioferritin-associated ferredoxin